MNRELLEKPFTPEQIKQREGSFGKMLDYIEGHAVIQRLNDAFDANWSFEILNHEILNDTGEVIVQGKLSTNGVVKTQFGSSRITKARESGEIISLADDLKSAGTDALKKCSTMLGVGLHLYFRDKPASGRPERPDANHSDRSGGNGGNGSGDQSRASNGNGNGRISSKQHKFILDLMKEAGMSKSELNDRCVETYGAVLAHINRSDASSLIDWLRS